MFSCKDLYLRDTTVFILRETTIVQRSAAKYFCLARCGPLYTFLLFRLQPRAKTISDNDQTSFLWHSAVCANSSTKVTSVCILMYKKLLLYPESSCLVWSFKTNAALKLRPFPIYHPLISSLLFALLSRPVRFFDWMKDTFVKQNILSTNFPNKPKYDFCFFFVYFVVSRVKVEAFILGKIPENTSSSDMSSQVKGFSCARPRHMWSRNQTNPFQNQNVGTGEVIQGAL